MIKHRIYYIASICVFIFMILGLGFNLFAQNTFELLFDSPYAKSALYVIENSKGQYVVVGAEASNIDGIGRNKIWKITSQGDTSTYSIDLGIKQSSFHYIENNTDSTYFIVGFAGDTSNVLLSNELLVIETDTLFNTIWIKSYLINEVLFHYDVRVLKDGFGYYVLGGHAKTNPSVRYPFFYRVNRVGDTLRTCLFNTFGGMNPVFDAMFSPDSSKIWWFSATSPSMYGRLTRREIDTIFSFLGQDTLQLRIFSNINVKTVSDTTFYLSCNYLVNDDPQDEDIGIFLFNNSLETLYFNHFGAIDTVDYPGNLLAMDFISPDSLFFVGLIDVFAYLSEDPSWIIYGQVDQHLQPRFVRIYGGDKFYRPLHILATHDGGCLINSQVYDPALGIYYFLILKGTSKNCNLT